MGIGFGRDIIADDSVMEAMIYSHDGIETAVDTGTYW